MDSATRVSIIATDPEGTIALFNKGAEEILGYKAGDMVGKHTPEIIHLESEVAARGKELTEYLGRKVAGFDVFVELARLHGSENREWTYIRKDGTHLTVELSVTAIFDDSKQITGYLGIGTDITARKETEKQLRESEGKLQAIINTAVDGILTINSRGMILTANHSIAKIFGYTREEMIGNNVTMIMPEPYRSEHDSYIRNYLESGQSQIIAKEPRPVEGVRKNGSPVPLELSVAATGRGESTIFVGILRDITQKVVARQKLTDANEELRKKQALIDRDLQAAAAIQQSLLPQHLSGISGVEIDWWFQPSSEIGGDIFNVIPLGSGKFALYMLDVSGHGVPSALVSVAVSQALSPGTGLMSNQNGIARTPSDVLTRLEEMFPLERFDKYFSIFYMLYDIKTKELTYSNAGQTPPVLLRKDGSTILLQEGGTMIGLGEIVPHSDAHIPIQAEDTLVIYTDGCIEHENHLQRQYGQERLVLHIKKNLGQEVDEVVEDLVQDIRKFGKELLPVDDLTIVCVKFR